MENLLEEHGEIIISGIISVILIILSIAIMYTAAGMNVDFYKTGRRITHGSIFKRTWTNYSICGNWCNYCCTY